MISLSQNLNPAVTWDSYHLQYLLSKSIFYVYFLNVAPSMLTTYIILNCFCFGMFWGAQENPVGTGAFPAVFSKSDSIISPDLSTCQVMKMSSSYDRKEHA